jgi:hypothetical protein
MEKINQSDGYELSEMKRAIKRMKTGNQKV